MKLVRFGPPGKEQPGVWLADHFGPGRHGILDIRAQAFDLEDFDERFFARWGLARVRALLVEAKRRVIAAQAMRLGPPVGRPGQIICVGKNYADHAAEFDAEVPATPILFGKAVSSVVGPTDPIIRREGVARLDAEAELAVVMGKTAREVAAEAALAHVGGYMALNDVTDRDAQREDQQWFRGKSADTYCPTGPWLVTADEVTDPQALRIASRLNGQPLQEGHSRNMLFSVARLIAYISRHITLRPGDIISTGTPAGVGFARKPPLLLKDGDTIEVEVEGVGVLRNSVQRA